MSAKLWSINGLSIEFNLDRRTVARRIRGIPPGGDLAGKPAWRLADVAAALTGHGTIGGKTGSPPPATPPGFEWLRGLPPLDAIAALALMMMAYRLPPALASLAVHSGASCREAFTVAELAKLALLQAVEETGRECGLQPWASGGDPAFVGPELFSEINWPHLAEIAGEPLDPAAWADYARSIAA